MNRFVRAWERLEEAGIAVLFALALSCGLLIGVLPLFLPHPQAAREIILAALTGCLGLGLAVYVVRDLAKRSEPVESEPDKPLRYATTVQVTPRLVLADVDLQNAVLPDAKLGHSELTDAQLTGADLRRADLCDSDLRGADLRGADLRGAQLERARTASARFGGAIYDEQTTWPEDSDPPPDAIRAESRRKRKR